MRQDMTLIRQMIGRGFRVRLPYQDYSRRVPIIVEIVSGIGKSKPLNIDNMDKESLKKSQILNEQIDEAKNLIKTVEGCHEIRSLLLAYGTQPVFIDPVFVSFSSLRKQLLTNMKKKLSEMEKEFAKM